jgi:hypothetical protein
MSPRARAPLQPASIAATMTRHTVDVTFIKNNAPDAGDARSGARVGCEFGRT